MKKYVSSFISILLVLSLLPAWGGASRPEDHNQTLWSAVKPLDTTVTFLNIGAHPDDERSDFLAYLSRGLGVKTASLIANRGEGGQNEIGQELGNALGIIRTREMIEASKITGVKAYHLSETTSDPIYDFGFSKTPEETLGKWGEELVYERLIRFIRTYKPDIIMPSFRDSDTQHGHHRTMTILSERAFKDAADPSTYPAQLNEGLTTWQPKKLYLPAESKESATLSLEIGMMDPVYGVTYPQLGEQSRFLHKSQGMGRNIPAEPRQIHLELQQKVTGEADSSDLFAGIPYDFAEWAKVLPDHEKGLKVHFTKFQNSLDSIISAYPIDTKIFQRTQNALKDTRKLKNHVKKAKLNNQLKTDLLHKLSIKEEQLQTVSFLSSNLEVEVTVGNPVLIKDVDTTVTVTFANNGTQTFKKINTALSVPQGWKVLSTRNRSHHLSPGETQTYTFMVHVTKDAKEYHPYDEPAIQANISYESEGVKTTQVVEPVETIALLPDIGLTLNPEDIVVNTANVQKEIPITITAKNYRKGKSSAQVSLDSPEGWKVSPAKQTVEFKNHAEEKVLTFTLSPPKNLKPGHFNLKPIAEVNGKTYDQTIQEIHYDHIGTFYYRYPAQINAVAFELLVDESLNIGYVESGFDKVAEYLTNAGLNITKLTTEDLNSGNLIQFDTIVIGIRAYLSRQDLVANNEKLKQYVKNGGHLVVQYHKPGDNWSPQTTAPYPLTLGNPSIRWRVTDENAKVTILQPDSRLFNYPNKITDSDWENWIQERGLYFPMQWDERYQTFVSMGDPNEAPFQGGILMAEYGKGTYLYTNLVFYRQIQGQVPGGYRIFTNLLSY